MPLPFIIGAVALAAAAGGTARAVRSIRKGRKPICPICDSKQYITSVDKGAGEDVADFLFLDTQVTLYCDREDCIEHYKNIGKGDLYAILPEPADKSKAPNCPKCEHNKYIGYSYKLDKYACNKHLEYGSIKGGKFNSNDDRLKLLYG